METTCFIPFLLALNVVCEIWSVSLMVCISANSILLPGDQSRVYCTEVSTVVSVGIT